MSANSLSTSHRELHSHYVLLPFCHGNQFALVRRSVRVLFVIRVYGVEAESAPRCTPRLARTNSIDGKSLLLEQLDDTLLFRFPHSGGDVSTVLTAVATTSARSSSFGSTDPGFPIWLWYFCPSDQSSRLDLRGFHSMNPDRMGDTQWVRKKPSPFSSASTGF